MAKIDLSKMSLKQLKDHLQDVEAAIRDAEITQRKETLEKIEEVAREAGFTVSELFGAKASGGGSKKSVTPPKYANPGDPKQTWSGKGRRPQWFVEKTEAGVSAEDMEV